MTQEKRLYGLSWVEMMQASFGNLVVWYELFPQENLCSSPKVVLLRFYYQ